MKTLLTIIFIFSTLFSFSQAGGCDEEIIKGNWLLLGDNDGTDIKEGAIIKITLSDGTIALKAVMGTEIIETKGFYHACTGLLTMEFDDFDFQCSNSFYKISGNSLMLPFGLLGNEGTASYWQREGTTPSKDDSNNDNGDSGDNGNNDNGGDDGSNGSDNGEGSDGNSGSNNGDNNSSGGANSGSSGNNFKGESTKLCIGKWIGSGWGWEVRFKHTAGDFASQFSGVDKGDIPMQNDKVIMTLLVEHSTQFILDVDASGDITGEGTITYNLIPNLCGVAALTESVNNAINIMGKMTFIYQLGKSLGQAAIADFRLSSYAMEDNVGDIIGLEGKTALSLIMDQAGSILPAKMKDLNLSNQQQQALCKCAAGVPSVTAGTKVGPSNAMELIQSMGIDVAKALFMDVALGSLPTGLMLSIPGVTQIQYHYKGLPDGPETRKFNIKGFVNELGEMHLEFDGYKSGDPKLYVEYEVNYKKERQSFPAWSPFTKNPGIAVPYGDLNTYEVEEYFVEKTYKDNTTNKNKKIKVPMKRAVAKTQTLSTPFVQFSESGQHRNGVKVWHEYEYNWKAYKLINQP